jgi:hypothetical protein
LNQRGKKCRVGFGKLDLQIAADAAHHELTASRGGPRVGARQEMLQVDGRVLDHARQAGHTAQFFRRVKHLDRAPSIEAQRPQRALQMRFIGNVVEQDRAVRAREAQPVADPEIGTHEDKDAAPRKRKTHQIDLCDRRQIGQCGQRLPRGPDFRSAVRLQQPVQVDRMQFRAAQMAHRIDQVYIDRFH